MGDIGAALELWREAIGASHVDSSERALSQAELATFATESRIVAILYPGSTGEVEHCFRVANHCQVSLYPVSSGQNWGYGSQVPPQTGSVLLDLRRLNRIVDFSEELAYVTVEPGVTQQQLFTFLKSRGSRLWMDATGSSPQCSIVGNTMERGFGHTPFGDHASHICGLEVVLPTGERIETGAARFPGSRTGSVLRWGIGPSLDGLFAQANLGVVTRMTVWLMAAPECFEAFFFRSSVPDGLPALVNTLRRLRLNETLRSSIHIGNDYRVLAGIRQYPWVETKGQTPLPETLLADFRKTLGFGYWNVSGALYGTRAEVKAARAILRRTLGRLPGTLKFLSPAKLRLAKRFAAPFRLLSRWDLSRTLSLVEPVLHLMQGTPTGHALSSAYWRKTSPPPKDPHPDRDRCGLLWYSPATAAEGTEVSELTELVRGEILRHGFEPAMSLTLISPRAVFCVISLAYDREIPGEDARARNCFASTAELCQSHGFYPYRLGIQNTPPPMTAQYRDIIERLKSAFDPNHVLAPGRYGIGKEKSPLSLP